MKEQGPIHARDSLRESLTSGVEEERRCQDLVLPIFLFGLEVDELHDGRLARTRLATYPKETVMLRYLGRIFPCEVVFVLQEPPACLFVGGFNRGFSRIYCFEV